MTTLQDKTPEELNVICAELLGFVRSTTHKFSLYGLCEIDQEATDPVPAFTKDGRWYRLNTLPPYATSYDAIMPEVQRVWKDRPATVTSILAKIVGSSEEDCLFFASPADLTRAMILTLQTRELVRDPIIKTDHWTPT